MLYIYVRGRGVYLWGRESRREGGEEDDGDVGRGGPSD